MDAATLLQQETSAGPLRLTAEQAFVVKGGLPDVVAISRQDEKWWTEKLGL